MIADFLKKLVKVFWLLPGLLLWASFPPVAEKTDCVFALAPLLWLARNRDAKTSFKKWFVNGLLRRVRLVIFKSLGLGEGRRHCVAQAAAVPVWPPAFCNSRRRAAFVVWA